MCGGGAAPLGYGTAAEATETAETAEAAASNGAAAAKLCGFPRGVWSHGLWALFVLSADPSAHLLPQPSIIIISILGKCTLLYRSSTRAKVCALFFSL